MTPSSGAGPRVPRALCIVPARLGSTRLPRKMLLDETGMPLVAHTARNASASGAFARVVVAYDDPAIAQALAGLEIETVRTRADHQSGTDRALEAFEQLAAAGEPPFEVVVNVQGDEPEMAGEDLRALVARLADPQVEFATLWAPLESEAELTDPSVVKVVADRSERALYFSRSPLPHARDGWPAGAFPEAPLPGEATSGSAERSAAMLPRRHIGVYALRPDALLRFCRLRPGQLEAVESLEQLRWLEAGLPLHLVRATRLTQGIDTRTDYEAFVARVRSAPRNE